MGTGSKVALVILRISEFISSVIVMSVIARFIHQINQAGADSNSRIIYTIVVACISTVYSLVFVAPLPYAFMAFPLDFVMFVLWLVVFCLDETVWPACPTKRLIPGARGGVVVFVLTLQITADTFASFSLAFWNQHLLFRLVQ